MRQADIAGRRAAGSRTLDVLARVGLACRAAIYLLVGVLAGEVAFGGHAQADQSGALKTVVAQPFGTVLVLVLAAGFAALTVWKTIETIWESPRLKDRLLNAGRVIVYAAGCAVAVSVVAGGGTSSDKTSHTATAQAMKLPAGQVLVGIAGGCVVVAGLVFIVQAFGRRFEDDLKTARMSQGTRRVVTALGVVGHTTRGIVVGAVGGFVVFAAVTFDPDKAKGLDATLKSFRDTPAGPWLLALLALGVCVFAAFCACEARWYRT